MNEYHTPAKLVPRRRWDLPSLTPFEAGPRLFKAPRERHEKIAIMDDGPDCEPIIVWSCVIDSNAHLPSSSATSANDETRTADMLSLERVAEIQT